MQYEAFDYVMVGAGSAGCVLVKRLIRQNNVIIVLADTAVLALD